MSPETRFQPTTRDVLGQDGGNATSKTSSSGFSLIELLVVIAVIAIVAAIAVPSLSQSKKAANEAAAISYMRIWTSAQELYRMKFGVYADADNQLVAEGLIGVEQGDRLGYIFSLDNPPGSLYTWWGQGRPEDPGVTGDRYFFLDSTGVMRWSRGGAADSSSPPLGAQPGS
ncbi:MAG: prepilin-type N-terminal cleavage/methylation domain-containing protein [Acidobacteriota bacterium]